MAAVAAAVALSIGALSDLKATGAGRALADYPETQETVSLTDGEPVSTPGMPMLSVSGVVITVSFVIRSAGARTVVIRSSARGRTPFLTLSASGGGPFELQEAELSATLDSDSNQPPHGVDLTNRIAGMSLRDSGGVVVAACSPVVGLHGRLAVPPHCQRATGALDFTFDVLSGPTPHDERYASETGFRVDDGRAWHFASSVGGLETLGNPVSRMFLLEGCDVQLFERRVLEECPGQGVTLANWLDEGWLPDGTLDGTPLPPVDAALKARTPQVGDPGYLSGMWAFMQRVVPDMQGGTPILFHDLLFRSAGVDGDTGLETFARALAIWGAPTSRAVASTDGTGVVTQRFQRGVMRFAPGSGASDVPLVQYVRDILLDKDLPSDLAAEAQASPYFSQYCGDAPLGVCRPDELPDTDLTDAFIRG